MDSLPMCIDLGRVQGCEDSLGCHEPGHEASNRGANLMWRSIAWSRQIHYSGLALHDYIVAGSIILRPANHSLVNEGSGVSRTGNLVTLSAMTHASYKSVASLSKAQRPLDRGASRRSTAMVGHSAPFRRAG